jgi:hypothetical protein
MKKALFFLLLALFVVPAVAKASYDPVQRGSTTLKLDPAFRSLLNANGIKLRATGGARLHAGKITFPVSGGLLDPVASRGIVEHEGSLLFISGAKRLPLRGLILKTTQAHSPLAAKFGGGKLKIAAKARLATKRAGFGLRADVTAMTLSAKVATRLAKKLRLRGVFHPGQPLGRAITVVQPATIAILGSGRATFAPDPAFMGKLNELFVSLNPIAPAEIAPGPLYSLPILGGELAPDGTSGSLTLGGSLEFLQLGAGQVFWTEPYADLGNHLASAEVEIRPSPPYPGKQGRVSILGSGATASVTSDPVQRQITVTGQALTLTDATAAAFNEAFGAPQGKPAAFRAGDVAGTLSFTAQGQ